MRPFSKTFLAFAASFLVFSSPSMAGIDDGLVAYYPFNGNADDESSNGYHGTVNGAILSEDRFGNIDSAYYFDGVDDYLNMGYALPHTEWMTDFSISVWTKVTSETWWHGIVTKPAGWGSQGYHAGFGVSLYRNAFLVHSNQDGWWPWASTTEGVMYDVWTHVAVTCRYISWREREFHIYVNGQESTLDGNVGITILGDPQLNVGAGGTGGSLGSYFNGYIDDIHIYNRPLTADEVSVLYDANGSTTLSALVDIKPGSFPNSINLGSGGTTAVAILGSADFDVTTINPDTLTLGTAGVKTVGKTARTLCSVADVSGDFSAGPEGAPDGFDDLVCHFITMDIAPEDGDTTATISGELNDTTPIEGTDSVNIVP